MGRINTSKRGRLAKPDVHFSETTLTSYAGAMPLLQFLNEGLEPPQLLAIAVPTEGRTRRYPVHLDAERRAHQEGRPVVRMGVQARQQYLYRQAGRLLRANNRWELRLAVNRRAAAIWAFYASPGISSA